MAKTQPGSDKAIVIVSTVRHKRRWPRTLVWSVVIVLVVFPCLTAALLGGVLVIGHRAVFLWQGGQDWAALVPNPVRVAHLNPPIFIGPQPRSISPTLGPWDACVSGSSASFPGDIFDLREYSCTP